MFGFASFYSYIFIRLRPCWGKPVTTGSSFREGPLSQKTAPAFAVLNSSPGKRGQGRQIIVPALGVFREGEKLFVT